MTTQRPLAGLRVLDLSRLLPGGYATMVLSDLGAQVDKVEDPRGGDYMRVMPPMADGMNTVFQMLNRGKRSAVLDLKTPEGREALLALLPHYDVLVESFRPGVMERLGLGYEALRQVHPGLVYCAITGYGQDGPMAARAGHDLNYLARAGVLAHSGPAEAPPQVPPVQMADIGGGGLFSVVSILAAVHERQRTGEGKLVDVSMCEGVLGFAAFGLMSQLGGMPSHRGEGVLMGGIAPYNTYETSDGRHITLAALEPKFWTAFCTGVGLEPNMEALAPGPHQTVWKERLAEVFRGRTRGEWEAFAEEHDCCLEPVLTPDELVADPQHLARGMFTEGPGGFPQPATPAARPAPTPPAPRQGEHTEAVLRDAGIHPDRIAQLVGRD